MTTGTGRARILALSWMLSACGGDGGGTASFTSWRTIQPNSAVVAQGLSQEDAGIGIPPFVSKSTTATMTFGADGDLSQMVLRTPSTTIDLDSFDFSSVVGFLDAVSSSDPTTRVIFANPDYSPRFDYQTFGVWETDPTAINSFGYFSVGAPTAGSNIPTTTAATFTGSLAGFYVAPDGGRFFAFGDVIVNADFASQRLAFSTENTFIRPDLVTPGNEIDRLDLDLNGTLSYASGTNGFIGPVESAGSLISGPLGGSSTGQFYGPNAEELGGVFSLQDQNDLTSLETYSGAYGATR